MENLAGLGILFGAHLLRLGRRQVGQDAFGQFRVEPKTFERGNDAVPAEGSAVPRNSGIGVGTRRSIGGHHVQIGNGAPKPAVELFAGGPNVRRLSLGPINSPALGDHSSLVRNGRSRMGCRFKRRDRQDGDLFPGRQGHLKDRLSGVDELRLGDEFQ